MIPQFANTFVATLYKRISNSYEYETQGIEFKARVSTTKERNSFFPLNGVASQEIKLSLYTQDDIVIEIKPNDRVVFMGNSYLVSSIGVYLDSACALAQSTYKNEDLIKRCPKGVQLV